MLVARNDARARQLHPFLTRCHEPGERIVKPDESMYGIQLVSAATSGWLIDEPGFYCIQAAVDLHGEVVMSNPMRIHVGVPANADEAKLALDYFSEDVGRVLAFDGAPELEAATNTLVHVADRLPGTPAATHALVAVTAPSLRRYKTLKGAERGLLSIAATDLKGIDEAVKRQTAALTKAPERAADTLGHIDYFSALDRLSCVLAREGDEKQARAILKGSIDTMKRRKVLPSVVAATERKLEGPAKVLAARAMAH
jgi:hypothetical protein